jgi:hypothetical protein
MTYFKSHTFTTSSIGNHIVYNNDHGFPINIYQLKINVKNDALVTFKYYDKDFNITSENYELDLKAGDTVIDESGYVLKNNDRFEISSTSFPIVITYKLEK